MKIRYLFAFLITGQLIISLIFSGNLTAQNADQIYEVGSIYFKYKEDIPINFTVTEDRSVNIAAIPFIAGLKDEFSIKSVSRPFDLNNDSKLLHTLLLEFDNYNMMDQLIYRLKENPELEYVEKVPVNRIVYTPDDSLYNAVNGTYNLKWHLDRIKADSAWDITKGSTAIKVAVVDNAVWADHPDLVAKIVARRNVANNNDDCNPPNSGDPFAWSHGTHVAGLVAASTDNGIGVASVGYDVSLIAVKANGSSNPESITAGYAGVQWAAENGADIINMSWGGYGYSQTNQNLFNTVHNMGIVLIAAAGNDNLSTLFYPASYDHVISIASTDGDDLKSSFSNYGSAIDLCSPGGYNQGGPPGLLSTTFSNGTYGYYALMSGTSMASPVASGMAGLILSVNPELTPEEVEDIMKTTTDDVYALNPTYIGKLGAGRINAYRAVTHTPYAPVAQFSTPLTTLIPGMAVNFNDLSTGVPSQWQWTFEGGSPSTSAEKDPAGITYPDTGTFDVSLIVSNSFGSDTLTLPDYITVTNTPLPVVFISVSDTNPCIQNEVVLQDTSLYDPVAWEWLFNPNTVTFLNGTNAASQNPEVKFTTNGDYTLVHNVWNANGMSGITYENLIHVNGIVPDYYVNMEDGTAGEFMLWDTIKSGADVDARAAFDSDFGIHFQGAPVTTGWQGSAGGTTATQAWNENRSFQAEAHICSVDGYGHSSLKLSFDLRQTYSSGPRFSWFRVLVNGVQIPDNHWVMDFNPVTMADDPWTRVYFNLSAYTGSIFDVTLQSCCRYSDKKIGEGDNVFIDNISIIDPTVTGLDEAGEAVFSVIPNPSDGKFRISASQITGKAMIKVASMMGNTVYSKEILPKDSAIIQELDLSFLPSGVYFLSITGTSGQFTQRVVIR
jgi:subtilisin family serine protease